jgi:hypothetical protein
LKPCHGFGVQACKVRRVERLQFTSDIDAEASLESASIAESIAQSQNINDATGDRSRSAEAKFIFRQGYILKSTRENFQPQKHETKKEVARKKKKKDRWIEMCQAPWTEFNQKLMNAVWNRADLNVTPIRSSTTMWTRG